MSLLTSSFPWVYFLLLFFILYIFPVLVIVILIIFFRKKPQIWIPILVVIIGGFIAPLFLSNGFNKVAKDSSEYILAQDMIKNDFYSSDIDLFHYPPVLKYRLTKVSKTSGKCQFYKTETIEDTHKETIDNFQINITGYSWWFIPTAKIQINCDRSFSIDSLLLP